MPDVPKPSSWPSKFLASCTSIAFGVVLIYLTVQLLRSMAVALIMAGVVIFLVWLLVHVRRIRRSRDWS